MAGPQPGAVLRVSPQPASGLSPALSGGVESFGEAAARDGLVGARAELDAPRVFHGRFANVPEQGEVPKQITMQDAAPPPTCPRLCSGTCLVSGEEGLESLAPVGSCPAPTQGGSVCWRGEGSGRTHVCACWLSAGAGVRRGQPNLSSQVGQVGRINFLFCPSHVVLASLHGSSSAQGIEIHQRM